LDWESDLLDDTGGVSDGSAFSGRHGYGKITDASLPAIPRRQGRVGLDSSGMDSDRISDVSSFSSLVPDAKRSRRRKPRLSCKLQSAVTALMACSCRLYSSSRDEVIKVKRLSMTRTRSTKM